MVKNIETIKKQILPILNAHEIKRAAVFGSFARGDNKKGSDVDILIEFEKRKGFFSFIALKLELEKKLGKKVDLVEYKAIEPYLKHNILSQQVRII